jgi:hypothetical protein
VKLNMTYCQKELHKLSLSNLREADVPLISINSHTYITAVLREVRLQALNVEVEPL